MSLKTVFAGVPTMDCRVEIVRSGCASERKCEYRSVSHSRSSPEEGQVCKHKSAVADVDCKERVMIYQGV